MQRLGDEAAFISAGGYHHHIGLNTWQSKGGSPPAPGTTGLFHLAMLYPTRRELADALKRVHDAGIPLDGASDHGVSEALYLRDPDENGVELYWDGPEAEWPRDPDDPDGVAMFTAPLDVRDLLAELDRGSWARLLLLSAGAGVRLRAVLATELLEADAGVGDLLRGLLERAGLGPLLRGREGQLEVVGDLVGRGRCELVDQVRVVLKDLSLGGGELLVRRHAAVGPEPVEYFGRGGVELGNELAVGVQIGRRGDLGRGRCGLVGRGRGLVVAATRGERRARAPRRTRAPQGFV